MDRIAGVVASALARRQDASAPEPDAGTSGFTVQTQCDSGNEFDGRIGLRVSSIFVILVGSLIGAMLPVVLARSSKMRVPKLAFFVAKYFGTGVIIATALIHLLTPAFEALGSPCLEDYAISQYSWAAGICLMSIFGMFVMEILIAHYDIFDGHKHDAESLDPSLDLLRKKGSDSSSPPSPTPAHAHPHSHTSSPSDLEAGTHGDHLGHARDHTENDSYSAFAAQMTAIFILEFGVIFHSIFIGLTLAVAGDEFDILYIVLVFHQTFEGLGLGARLATASWPKAKSYMPYLLAGLYAISTPIAIAVGLGVRQTLSPSNPTTLIVNGVFDSISAGILLYTGLVELLAHEFMFNPDMQKAGLRIKLLALGCIASGAGLMALLGKWA
ncbi:plasma membrane low affinity zinc ion transporter [Apiospora saccharicola]|uniref:Plasma membrane low affinity zinc ion transporter n=1 Tax=Apiospora saccharicola TaxID=335842 RepID=A0ABR1UFV3_9PEZI